MVKKLRAMAQSAGSDHELASAVKESAQQIWMAGLGAFSKAQEEGQKLFTALVKEGSALEERGLRAAGAKLTQASGRLSGIAGQFQKQATGTLDKLESVFEERVERALKKLGVPSSKEIEHLLHKVEQLTAAVNKLSTHKAPAKKTAAKKKTSRTRAKKAD